MISRIGNVTTLIADIANSAREQSLGLTEINTGVKQLDEVTQRNAAVVVQSTTSAEALHNDAARLTEGLSILSGSPHARAGLPSRRCRWRPGRQRPARPHRPPQYRPRCRTSFRRPCAQPEPTAARWHSGRISDRSPVKGLAPRGTARRRAGACKPRRKADGGITFPCPSPRPPHLRLAPSLCPGRG